MPLPSPSPYPRAVRTIHSVRRRGAAVTTVVVVAASLTLTGSAGTVAAATTTVVDSVHTSETGSAPAQTQEQAQAPAQAATTPAEERAPGGIVSTEPTSFRTVPGLPTLTKAWKIHYRSTDARGRPNVVSGTVIVPKDGRYASRKSGERPLISYAVGTVGLGDQCAPSNTFPQGKTTEAPLIAGALARGWAVAVTDYEGLGTPGDHTYTVGSSEGHAVLDAARAAQRLPQAEGFGVSERSPVGLMGYSQGGQASGWAAELSSTYAPELDIKGTASGGVPADLGTVADGNNGNGEAGLVLMAAIGHDAAFPELDLDGYLNQTGKEIADFMRQNCVDENNEAGAGKTIDDVTVTNPLEEPDWQAKLAADRLGTEVPGHPVYLYHAQRDEVVDYEVGRQLRDDWCARGVPVQWKSYPLQQHVGAAFLGSGPAMDWLSKRFAGVPAEGNCGT